MWTGVTAVCACGRRYNLNVKVNLDGHPTGWPPHILFNAWLRPPKPDVVWLEGSER